MNQYISDLTLEVDSEKAGDVSVVEGNDLKMEGNVSEKAGNVSEKEGNDSKKGHASEEARETPRTPFRLMRYHVHITTHHNMQVGGVTIVLLMDSEFGKETLEFTKFIGSFKERFNEKCRALNKSLATKQKLKWGSVVRVRCSQSNARNGFVYFLYDKKNKTLTTNINVHSELVGLVRDVYGIEKRADPVADYASGYDHGIADIQCGPTESRLREAEEVEDVRHILSRSSEGFVETAEKVTDLDWVYGCKQHDSILFVLVSTTARSSLEELLCR